MSCDWLIGSSRQDLTASIGNQYRVFKLRTALSICRDSGPGVGQCKVTGISQIDHWLHGKNVLYE
jgi:hypothetical protein